MYHNYSSELVSKIICDPPDASARVVGSADHPELRGEVYFYRIRKGTMILADIGGLPQISDCGRDFFGFHIHEGNVCAGTEADPFADTKGHFNPLNAEHPCHEGDLPVLLSNQGHAWTIFCTNAFTPAEITGRTVVIHDMPDDYRSQPAGAAGNKIACGVIELF